MPQVKVSDSTLALLVERVRAGDGEAIEQLYRKMRRFAAYWVVRQIGFQDYEDILHDTFLIVLRAVKAGELRHQRALMSYTRTVVQCSIAAKIRDLMNARNTLNTDGLEAKYQQRESCFARALTTQDTPESKFREAEKTAIMADELRRLSGKDQEILRRFYLDGQPWPDICVAMNLTHTTFRLNKSRAKKRLEKLVTKRLRQTPFGRQLAKAA